ncbi:magnesium transporter [Perilla frutescens var. hirtella]|nr:magnesium transporter [Perilla frutescens var. hirtella]
MRGASNNVKGLVLAISSSIFIGSSFIIKKKGLKKAGASGTRASTFNTYRKSRGRCPLAPIGALRPLNPRLADRAARPPINSALGCSSFLVWMLAMFLKSPIASHSRCANRFSRSYLFNYNVLSLSPRAGKDSKPESLSPRERAAKRERMVLDIKVKLHVQCFFC